MPKGCVPASDILPFQEYWVLTGYSRLSLVNLQVKNDVVIWDRIVRRKEDAVINVAGKNKYVFKEVSSSFK